MGLNRFDVCSEFCHRLVKPCDDPNFRSGVSDAIFYPVAIIFILCFVGVFATTDRMFDVWLMLVLGLGGYCFVSSIIQL